MLLLEAVQEKKQYLKVQKVCYRIESFPRGDGHSPLNAKPWHELQLQPGFLVQV